MGHDMLTELEDVTDRPNLGTYEPVGEQGRHVYLHNSPNSCLGLKSPYSQGREKENLS